MNSTVKLKNPNAEDTFGDRLIRLMRLNSINNKQLGEIVNVTGQAVGKWRSNKEIKLKQLRDISSYFGVDWLWLRFGDEVMETACDRRISDAVGDSNRKLLVQLQQKNDWFELVLEEFDIGVWDLDMSKGSIKWSGKISEIYGKDSGVMEGSMTDFAKGFHPDDVEEIQDELAKSEKTEDFRYSLRHRIITDSGKVKFVKCASKGFRDESGKPIRMLGATRCISHWSVAGRGTKILDGIMLDSDNEIYIIASDTGRFINVSESALRNLQRSFTEMLALTPLDIKPLMSEERFDGILDAMGKDGDTITFNTEHERRDGTVYPVFIKFRRADTETGVFYIATVTDLSVKPEVSDDNL